MRARCLAVLFMLFSLVACATEPYVVEPDKTRDAMAGHVIYVISHGWHTGFVVAGRDLNALVPPLGNRFGEPLFYEVGWGDEGFYQAETITVGLAVRAAFWPTDTVLHVVAIPQPPDEYFPESQVFRISLSQGQYEGLLRFITQSFAAADSAQVLPLSNGIYGNSQFYRARGRYFLFNTCNSWTAKGLKSAGFDLTPALMLTAGSVIGFLGGADNALAVAPRGPEVAAREIVEGM